MVYLASGEDGDFQSWVHSLLGYDIGWRCRQSYRLSVYGLIFDASTPFSVADFVSFGTGYSTFLHGKVVDMFYFPIIRTTYPEWMPMVGGDDFVFFSPIFNFADSCISVGVAVLLLFFRNDLERMSLAWKK